MILKRPLCPERVRKPPAGCHPRMPLSGINWLDHRLVRNGYLDKCSHQAAALYLFLVTVADAQGLSYYSDASLMKRLHMDSSTLAQARRNLMQAGLIAYQKPLYQALALDGNLVPVNKTAVSSPLYRRPQSLKEILKQIMEDKT